MQVDCYVVALDRNDEPFFIATAIHGDLLEGLRWNGRAYSDSETLPLSELEAGRLNITHYYGLSEIIYESIFDVAWNYFTKLVYIKIGIYRYFDSTYQYFFNKRKLITKKRMELLRLMMDDQLDRTHDGISSLDLMTKIYSMRMFLHPSWEMQHRKVNLFLESLVRSGELSRVNDEYVVTGGAISTIEKYEEEERRHTEAVKVQKKIF